MKEILKGIAKDFLNAPIEDQIIIGTMILVGIMWILNVTAYLFSKRARAFYRRKYFSIVYPRRVVRINFGEKWFKHGYIIQSEDGREFEYLGKDKYLML